MTETDSDITRGYNSGTRDYDSITRSYRREREGVGTNTNNDDITRGITNGYEDITNGYDSITKGYERE
nr:MAG: hypothetical protein [Bacteriophage sp.]